MQMRKDVRLRSPLTSDSTDGGAETDVSPLDPNSDWSEISHCIIKGLLVRKVKRIENMITQVKFSYDNKKGVFRI